MRPDDWRESERRLAARERGKTPEVVLRADEVEHGVEIGQKAPRRSGGGVRVEPTMPPPMTHAQVKAKQAELIKKCNTLEAVQPDGTLQAYHLRGERFERVPNFDRKAQGFPRQLPDLAAEMRARVQAQVRASIGDNPRGRRERRTSGVSAGGGDPPDDADGLDSLTALQRGFLLLLEALVETSSDGLVTFLVFLELAANRVAAEITRLHRWSDER